MEYNNKKHYYDPYDSLDVEWKAKISHEKRLFYQDSAVSTSIDSLQTASSSPRGTRRAIMKFVGRTL